MRKRMIKCLSAVLAALMFAAAAAGCALPQDQEQTVQKEEKPEMEVWTFFSRNVPGSYYVFLWDTLAEQYGYAIDVKTYSMQQMKNKLQMALSCNELPDIFLVPGGTYPEYLFDSGACLPVQEYIGDIAYTEPYMQEYKDGNRYVIPCMAEGYAVMYCDTSLMQEMDLTMPADWEELLELTEKVEAYNRANGTDYAAIELGEKDSWLGEVLYDMIVNRIDPYAYDRLRAGEITFSDPVFREAAQRVEELVESGAFPEDYIETGEAESVKNFIRHEAVLFPHESTLVYHLIQNMGAGGFQVMQFPDCGSRPEGGYTAYMMNMDDVQPSGLCVNSRSPYRGDAARMCAEFAREVNATSVQEYGYLNITEEQYELPENLPLPVQQLRSMVENTRKLTPDWYAALPGERGNNWRNLTKKLFAGEIDVDTFLEEGSKILVW